MSVSAIYVKTDDLDDSAVKSICAKAAIQIAELLAALKSDTGSVVTVFLHGEPSYDLTVTVESQSTVDEVTKYIAG